MAESICIRREDPMLETSREWSKMIPRGWIWNSLSLSPSPITEKSLTNLEATLNNALRVEKILDTKFHLENTTVYSYATLRCVAEFLARASTRVCFWNQG